MLKEAAGDILRTTAEMVAHGVAPNDGYANGLALNPRQQWPAMYKDFRHYCRTCPPKTGELWAWAGAGGVRVRNLSIRGPGEGGMTFRHREQSRIGVGRHVPPLRGLTTVPAAFRSVRHPLP